MACKGYEEVPESIKRVFVTAMIFLLCGILNTGGISEYVDNAVSKTVNFPNSAQRKISERFTILPMSLDVKSNVYRDGSRDNQVLQKPASGKVKRQRMKEHLS
jgi:ribonucleoside-diphosphate reductase alpha chain